MTDPTLKQALETLRLDRSATSSSSGFDPESARPRKRRWLRWGLLAVAVLAVGMFLLAGRPVAVTVATATEAGAVAVEGGGLVPVLNASGYVVARRQATVSSQITGRIVELLVEEGLRVEEGQVLARLDDSELQRALSLGQAQLQAARKRVTEVEVRLAQARRDLERSAKLAADGIGSTADLDAMRAEADSFEARLAATREEVTVAERVVGVTRQQLENTVIRAPFSGVAISKNAQPGEMISPVSAGGGFTRTGVSTIVDMTSLEIEVDVNENYIQRVRSGQQVEARLNAYPDWTIPATVITSVPAADRESATVRVRIAFDALDPRILPDMGVKVAFLADAAEAATLVRRVAVPASALRKDGDDDIVFVAREGTAQRRKVDVAGRAGDLALLASGIAAGDVVIVSGPEDLKDGQRIRAQEPTSTPTPTGGGGR